MKYYGIAVIPTQVLLDKQGKEFFRHSGFISTGDLETHFRNYRIYPFSTLDLLFNEGQNSMNVLAKSVT